MNDAHLHLAINHFPLIAPIIALIVLVYGFISKSEQIKRVSYLIFVIGALSTIPSFKSGEAAEEVVEDMKEIQESYIEDHEEAAETFAVLSYVLGGFALIGFWASNKNLPLAKVFSFVIFFIALTTIFFGKATGTTGGEIRHTEITPK